MRYLERPITSSTSPKFRIIRFEFECVTSVDDCIDELLEQGIVHFQGIERILSELSVLCIDFLRTTEWQANDLKKYHSTKVLLYFANIQNGSGTDMLNLLLNNKAVSNICHKLFYPREDNPSNFKSINMISKVSFVLEIRFINILLFSINVPYICDNE